MANAINASYFLQQKNLTQIGKRGAVGEKNNLNAQKNLSAQYGGNFSVELSSNGLSALATQQKNSVDDAGENLTSLMTADEKKLSATAQEYLKQLREKYGDFDFVVADDMSSPQSFSQDSAKKYSVVLSTEEIERMAVDEDYEKKVMGQVDSAVEKLDSIAEKAELGEGVQFNYLAAEFDDEGNMKLFAGLEKLSEEQAERMEEAKEKRAEENKSDEENSEEEKLPSASQKVELEASSVEEMLEKIFGIKWGEVEEQFA